MMFSNDAITQTYVMQGVVSRNFSQNGGPNTILSVAMQQENNSSDTTVLCNGDTVARNYSTNFSNVPMSYQCDGDIIAEKTGNDQATVVITYVPYLTGDFSTSTNPSVSITGPDDVTVYGSLTAGDIVIGFILLMQLFIILLYILIRAIFGVTTGRKYIQYSNGDVPIVKEL